jgi:ABC-type nitrate/sulfonate/bicarbonate transport system substrate-binding protein
VSPRTRSTPPVLALVAVLVAALLSGCGGSSAAAGGAKELRYQGWTNQVTLPELAADLGYLKGVKLSWVGNTISGPQDIQAVVAKQVDVGGAFDGAVANLVAKGAPIQAVISYYGSDAKAYNGFYVLSGSPIRAARDLVGKKVGVNTLGGHNEAVIDSYLAGQGLSADEIDQVQLVPLPPPNTDQALRAGQIDVAALSGQFRDQTLAKGGVRALFTDSQLFGDFSAGTYVFRKEFIKAHPETVRAFVEAVGKAIEWTRSTPQPQVIQRYEKIINARKRNESTASLKYWHSAGVATKGGVIQDSDFARWEPWLRSSGSIGGKLDVRAVYTNEFNPFAGATP